MAPELSYLSTEGEERKTWSSLRSIRIQNISIVAQDRALYSASVLNLETVCCFLAYQEIKLEPR
jgi:hypothetical protein